MPVASLLEFLFDDISDQKDLASTEEVGNDEGCKSRYKYHGDSTDDPRNTERKDDLGKCLDISGTEISGCGNNIFVNLYKYIVNRQHHERQEVVDHAEDDGCRCVDHVPGWQPEKVENGVDDTVFLQKILPCKGS